MEGRQINLGLNSSFASYVECMSVSSFGNGHSPYTVVVKFKELINTTQVSAWHLCQFERFNLGTVNPKLSATFGQQEAPKRSEGERQKKIGIFLPS